MVLDVALLVAPSDPAEVVAEEEVALQAQELPGQLALAPDDLCDRDRGVVVAGAQSARRRRTRKRPRGRPGRSRCTRGDRPRRSRRPSRAASSPRGRPWCSTPAIIDRRLAEVELGLTRAGARAGRRPPCASCFDLGDGGSHLRGAPCVAVLVSEALEDAPGRVALLWRCGLVGLEDLVDHAQEVTELGASGVRRSGDSRAARGGPGSFRGPRRRSGSPS